MKVKEFKTSKGEFVIVDGMINLETWGYDEPLEFISKLSEITEDQAIEIADSIDENVSYKTSIMILIKSLGIHLYENNEECSNFFCENGKIDIGYSEFISCGVCEEAEQNTFYNPYIFKKI